MSTPTPTTITTLDWAGTLLVQASIGLFLKNSDPALRPGRAQAIVSINEALILVDTGDPTGPAALASAINGVVNSKSDPGLSDAFLTLAKFLETEVGVVSNLPVFGMIVTNLNVAIFAVGAKVAAEYLPAPASKPAPVKDIRKALDPTSQVSLRRPQADAEVAGQATAQA